MLQLDVIARRTTHGRPFIFLPRLVLNYACQPSLFLLQTKRVPRRLQVLDVETQPPPRRLLEEEGECFKYLFERGEKRCRAFILPHLASLKASINNVAPVSCRLSVLEN